MKTQEELNALKNEVEALNKKLAELSEEELAQISGGREISFYDTPDLSDNVKEEKQGNNVAIFPGLSGFP